MVTGNNLTTAGFTSKDDSLASEPNSLQYLLLELSSEQLSFCKFHLAKNKLTHCESIESSFLPNKLKKSLQDSAVLSGDFEQSILSIVVSNYCVVPRTYLGDDLQKVFELTNEFKEEDEVLLNYPLVNLRANVLYTIPKELQASIYAALPQVKLIPHIAPRIENALNKKVKLPTVIAHLSEEHVDILVFQRGQLQMANSFFQASKEDIAYYALFCAEALEIDTNQTPLLVSGTVHDYNTVIELLGKYWKHVTEPSSLDTLDTNPNLKDIPKQSFNHLTQLLLCAS